MEHNHDITQGFWGEYFSLLTDPAHLLFELTFTIVFDVLIVAVIYGVIIKQVILPKMRKQIQEEVHESHGLEPHDEDCIIDENIENMQNGTFKNSLTIEEVQKLKQLIQENDNK